MLNQSEAAYISVAGNRYNARQAHGTRCVRTIGSEFAPVPQMPRRGRSAQAPSPDPAARQQVRIRVHPLRVDLRGQNRAGSSGAAPLHVLTRQLLAYRWSTCRTDENRVTPAECDGN